MDINLYDHQKEALENIKNGCILDGPVGSGKSRTALAYYFINEGGCLSPFEPMRSDARDLYVITTAAKRDRHEFEDDMRPFLIHPDPEVNYYNNKVVVDSWNNIKKYKNVYGAFFIFDEQRVSGSGSWVKSFLEITRKGNKWILLSATPGDCWMDYAPVFIANGFYKNKTDFKNQHVLYSPFVKRYPKFMGYMNEKKLRWCKNQILVYMPFDKPIEYHHLDLHCDYDELLYNTVTKHRKNPYEDNTPIETAASFCYILQKIVNSDPSRIENVMEIVAEKKKVIIFYNYDYEREILLNNLYHTSDGEVCDVAEWTGHKHEPVPTSDAWVYIVNYKSGAEGWNCITCDTIIFYSQCYSYRTMVQAGGRIDRANTPFRDLFYYHLKSYSKIDRAIGRALKEKKEFNENDFGGKF